MGGEGTVVTALQGYEESEANEPFPGNGADSDLSEKPSVRWGSIDVGAR